eukprot:scaffold154074_cov23-Tisochrysis_lutea.AAC.1
MYPAVLPSCKTIKASYSAAISKFCFIPLTDMAAKSESNLFGCCLTELVDCDRQIDMGCSGGMMNNAYDFVRSPQCANLACSIGCYTQNGGLDTEEDWPYNGIESPAGCDTTREGRHVVTIDGFQVVPPGDEVALLKAVAHQ